MHGHRVSAAGEHDEGKRKAHTPHAVAFLIAKEPHWKIR
jgi:hypothetical protein